MDRRLHGDDAALGGRGAAHRRLRARRAPLRRSPRNNELAADTRLPQRLHRPRDVYFYVWEFESG